MKTGTIEVTVKVYLTMDLDSDADEKTIHKIVTDVVEGEQNPLIDNIELWRFETE